MTLCPKFEKFSVRFTSSTALHSLRPPPMPDPVRWGPDNPYPLSQMRTELVWDGKYDEYGRRRSVDVAGASMPMQKIETVDMPRSEALDFGQTKLGELSTTVREDFRNRLIWGISLSCSEAYS